MAIGLDKDEGLTAIHKLHQSVKGSEMGPLKPFLSSAHFGNGNFLHRKKI